jgi:transcriptional regulator with XRE-family HTH domain
MTRKALGEFIAHGREARDMTQVELADKVGVGSGQVSKWERGLSLPAPRKLAKLAAVLGLDIGELAERFAAAGQEDAVTARRELSEVRRDLEFALAEVTRFVDTYSEFHAEYERISDRVEQLTDDVTEIKQAILRLSDLVLRVLEEPDR